MIHQELVNKLKERNIKNLTKIQELVIPKLIEGKSVLFRSATGTGKTFAYLLPIINELISRKDVEPKVHKTQRGIEVLICAPTLELCSQIENEINFLFQNIPSAPYIVGTPGKLFSLAKTGKLKLNNLRFLVLDEADRLMSREFMEDTLELLSIAKKHRDRQKPDGADAPFLQVVQVIGCSATVSKKTQSQLGPLFKDAEFIECNDNKILRDQIEHWAIFSEKRKKAQTLRSFIAAINNQTGKSKKSKIKILVFTGKNDDAALIHSKLLHHKVCAAALFGKIEKKPISAERRKEALDSFRNGRAQVLVATDLAARGLDIPGVTHVVAMDVPCDAEYYEHRAGRTARAGKRGIMATIGDETQMRLLASLEKELKIRITPKELYGGYIRDIAN